MYLINKELKTNKNFISILNKEISEIYGSV